MTPFAALFVRGPLMRGAHSGFDRLRAGTASWSSSPSGATLSGPGSPSSTGSPAAARSSFSARATGGAPSVLRRLAPGARIHCVDSSRGMIERASRRIAAAGAGDRVTFECADALSFSPGPASFDAGRTLFFLDCFDEAGVASIVARIDASLRPGARWLFADFVAAPARAGPPARPGVAAGPLRLLPATPLRCGRPSCRRRRRSCLRAGWGRTACRDFQLGLLRSAVFERVAAAPRASPSSLQLERHLQDAGGQGVEQAARVLDRPVLAGVDRRKRA